jgi:hypothetical protein
MYFFSFLSILGWISFFYFWRKKYAAYYPLLVVTGLISLLYIFAYIKILNLGSIALFALGLFFLVKTIILNIRTISRPKKAVEQLKNLPVSIIFFSLAGIAWYLFTLKASIMLWDEFFWGQFAKAILNSNSFYTLNSAILTSKASYPPGIALFQYFFGHFSLYREGLLYFAQGIIVFSALALIFDLTARVKKFYLIVGLIIFSAIVYFGPGLLSIMNDHVLGVIFGSAILALLFILRSNKSKLLLFPVIFSLPLIKSTGIVLALTVVLAAALVSIISSANLFEKKKGGLKVDKFIFVLIIILSLAAIIPAKSWDFRLKIQGVETASFPSWSKIKNAFSDQASEREKSTIRNFGKVIVSLPINQQEGTLGSNHPVFKLYFKAITAINRPALSIPTWLLIFAILFGIIFYFQKPKERTVGLALYFSLLAGLAAYLVVHLFAYIFYFSEFEAENFASISRYLSTYFLGLSIIVIGSVAHFISNNPDKSKFINSVSFLILLYLFIFHTPPLVRLIVPPKLMAASTNVVREKTREFSLYINANTENSSRVWLINQNTNGWECMITRYDIAPRIMNAKDWSLGNAYGPDDIWTNKRSAEDWAGELLRDHYNYVFLAKVDDNFWSNYHKLFENPVEAKSRKLFRVERENNEVILIAK